MRYMELYAVVCSFAVYYPMYKDKTNQSEMISESNFVGWLCETLNNSICKLSLQTGGNPTMVNTVIEATEVSVVDQ